MRYCTVLAIAVCLTFALAGSAGAQTPTQPFEFTAPPSDEGSYLPAQSAGPSYLSILDVAGKLVIAVLIAYGLLHAVRWWQNSQMQGGGGGGSTGRCMRLEETLNLGGCGRLHLVEVEGRRLLLGSHEDGLRQIADLTEEPREPTAYRSVRQRADGGTDVLNVSQSRISTRPVRPELVDETESWEKRRNRLLAELQEHD